MTSGRPGSRKTAIVADRQERLEPPKSRANAATRTYRVGMSRRSDWRHYIPRVFAILLTLLGLFCAIEAIGSAFRSGLRPLRDVLDAVLIPNNGNLAYAAVVFLLAAAIARRKRVAWRIILWITCVQLALAVVAFIVVAVSPGTFTNAQGETVHRGVLFAQTSAAVVVAGAILAVLILGRREFYALVRHASFRRAVLVALGLLGIGVLLGWGLVAIFPGTLGGGSGTRLLYSASRVLGGTVRFTSRDLGDAPGAVNLILGLFGAIAILVGFSTLLSSQRAEATLPLSDEERIRDLLAKTGERDSLGYFATRRDKSAIFSPSGKAAVTYRVVNGVSLASADPIGDPEAWGPAVQAWIDQARAYAWVPAAMGASEEGAIAYQRAGLKVVELGDEAILHTNEFTLDGRDMRPVRQAVNRLERADYTVRVSRHDDLTTEAMAEVVRQANDWRDTESERGFSMALGRLGDPSDGQCVLVEAFDGHGSRKAMLSLSPWGRTGLSLDLMRRDPHAENGTMELMVSELMRATPRLGVNRVSLNFAVFRSVFEQGSRIGAGPLLRAWRQVLVFLSRWWQLESLYRSNMKYRPEWVPRYLCLGERRVLLKVGLASAIAEGFLSWPPGHKPTPLGAGGPDGEVAGAGLVAGTTAGSAAAATLGAETKAATTPEAKAAEAVARNAEARPEQERVRREKLAALRADGVEPYPVTFARTHACAEVTTAHPGLAPDTHTGDQVAIAGRVMLLRDHGTRCFATVRDWTGDLQVMLEPPADVSGWTATVDIGDQIGVRGEVITTHTGQVTVSARDWMLTSKCLHPLPDKHRGLADPESKVRRRYLDLITSPASRGVLRARSAAIHSLRTSFVDRGFIELETPILQRIHGGANARPFTTHINAYDLNLYLRIAPELFLKRLAVGGVEKVFEIGRTFRNEGVSFKHNPEFTILEAYQAYADYMSMLHLTREIVQAAALAANGHTIVRWPAADGTVQECDIAGEWPVLTVNEAISRALGEKVTADTEIGELRRLCDRAKIPYEDAWGRGAVVEEMYERLVEHETRAPTFYTNFPTDVSPLTRADRHDPRLAERWDLVAFGTELGTAYSELIDPIEQRIRLTEQSMLAAGGDPEAMELDEDFLTAMEYAMPPTGGLGMGVDRLIMLLTGHTIRETLPFPMVRPAESTAS